MGLFHACAGSAWLSKTGQQGRVIGQRSCWYSFSLHYHQKTPQNKNEICHYKGAKSGCWISTAVTSHSSSNSWSQTHRNSKIEQMSGSANRDSGERLNFNLSVSWISQHTSVLSERRGKSRGCHLQPTREARQACFGPSPEDGLAQLGAQGGSRNAN